MYRCCNNGCDRNNCHMMNNCQMNSCKDSSLETICDNVSDCGCCNSCGNINNNWNNNWDNDCNSCGCGFNEEESVFPLNPLLGQSYVPVQRMSETFTPCCGLENGTIFPELVNPYYPCQSIEDINYLKSRNTIGEGCNTCS